MTTQNTQITTEKLLETIGLQTVELNIYRSNNAQLMTEVQRLRGLLEGQTKDNDGLEEG
jgi:hypothetical protein